MANNWPQARFLEMTSKYQEEENSRRRGYVEEDPADSGNILYTKNPKQLFEKVEKLFLVISFLRNVKKDSADSGNISENKN